MNKPHKRYNPLTDEWILVSPHRTQRPWQGQSESISIDDKPSYDPDCYLCPNNKRANGEINPDYKSTFVFKNDFSALVPVDEKESLNMNDLIKAETENGICKVVCFSPQHNLTLSQLQNNEILDVINTWQNEYEILGSLPDINHVQIFENRGLVMGASNPHPHGQIWAQESIPMEPFKEQRNFKKYYDVHNKTLLADYIALELENKERIVYQNSAFVVIVPFWAVWPYETMIASKRAIIKMTEFNSSESNEFADALKVITTKYDKVFNVSFPYSAGIHQSPTDNKKHPEWHFHMHFYPPLLRSATVKKFMVGYEMLGNPQRDITAEFAASLLREISI